jgi:hypothetical protein
VPRNERGNVEVPPFTSALPPGTVRGSKLRALLLVRRARSADSRLPCRATFTLVRPRACVTAALLPRSQAHIRLPNLAVVCRRLGVDYAPALTGFDIRAGRSVPCLEGVVVCAEHEAAVRAAAAEEEQRRQEKARQQRLEASAEAWRLLLRSLLTRIRLERSYGGGGAPEGAMAEAAAVLLRDTHDHPPAMTQRQGRKKPRGSGDAAAGGGGGAAAEPEEIDLSAPAPAGPAGAGAGGAAGGVFNVKTEEI